MPNKRTGPDYLDRKPRRKKKKDMKIAYEPKSSPDRSYGGSGPGSLLDRRDKDLDKPRGGYPSDKQFPSGTFPLAKKKKKKSRIA